MRENQAEDERCLANVEELIEKQAKLGIPVAGMMVEPIQAEGGDYHGSKEFFQVSDMVEERAFAIELVMSIRNFGSIYLSLPLFCRA